MIEAGALVGALGAALLLLSRSRATLLAGFVLVGAGAIGLVLAFDPEAERLSVPTSPAAISGALVALGLLGAFAAALVRFPSIVIPLLLLTAPLRPPLDPDTEATLLVTLQPAGRVGYHFPFYATLAAAALGLVWQTARGAPVRAIPRAFALPAAGLIALTALSLLWSRDESEGISQLMLFWLPFAALVAVVARAPFAAWHPRALAAIVVASAAVFALVGIGEWIVGEVLFYTPGLEQANATASIFRVTSLFQDPSIYARHLVVGMSVVLVVLWLGRVRVAVALSVLAVLAAGLYFSYSQSAMVALVVVAAGIAFAAGDARVRRLIVVGALGLAIVGAGILAGALVEGSAQSFTRNRLGLVTDTATVFANHPLIGVGVGGQPVASREEADTGTSLGRSSSHTTPLTIAAELGIGGLALYAALLYGTARLLVAVWRRDPPLGLGMATILLVLFIHALVYEGFFEEPTTWGLMAVAVAALASNGTGPRTPLKDTAAARRSPARARPRASAPPSR
jgi:hypothetical protein